MVSFSNTYLTQGYAYSNYETIYKTKKREVRDTDDNMLRIVDISLAELLLIKSEYVRPIGLLSFCCYWAWSPKDVSPMLHEEEYDGVQKLPLYFKAKFNIKPQHQDKVPVLIYPGEHQREISLIS